MEFQSGDMPNYTTSDGSVCFSFSLRSSVFYLVYISMLEIDTLGSSQVKIQKDSEVRLKIIGTRVDATEIVCPFLFVYSEVLTVLIFQLKPA